MEDHLQIKDSRPSEDELPIEEIEGSPQSTDDCSDSEPEGNQLEPLKKQAKVNTSSEKQSIPQQWGAQGFAEDDHKKITSNQWLSDKHINACSILLKKKSHQSQSGLHDVLILATKPLKCGSLNDFVQIIHVNQSHYVYDSIPNYFTNSKVLNKLSRQLPSISAQRTS